MPQPSTGFDFDPWREDLRGNRTLRRAVAAAILLHALLITVELPAGETPALATDRAPRVYVLSTPRFAPPPPPTPVAPQPRATRVPMPDPTPDDPEPLRGDRELPALPDLDLDLPALAIPDAPAPPPARPTEPIAWHSGIDPPARTTGEMPGYTEPARLARIQGVVLLRAVIDASGTLTELEVIRGLPMGLTQSALDAVARWRFEPARWNGRPVAVIYNLSVKFQCH